MPFCVCSISIILQLLIMLDIPPLTNKNTANHLGYNTIDANDKGCPGVFVVKSHVAIHLMKKYGEI